MQFKTNTKHTLHPPIETAESTRNITTAARIVEHSRIVYRGVWLERARCFLIPV